jgi:hypothetical protein
MSSIGQHAPMRRLPVPCLAMLRPLLVFSLACRLAAPANAQSPATNSLAQLRTLYEARLLEIALTEAVSLRDLSARYTARLDELIDQTRRQGQLEALLALRNQRREHEATRFVPEGSVPGCPPVFATLQQAYHRERIQTMAARQNQTAELARTYVSALEQHKRDLTVRNRIDEAVALQQEIEAVKASLSAPATSPSPGTASGAGRQPPSLSRAAGGSRPGATGGPVFAWDPRARAGGEDAGHGGTGQRYPLKAEGNASSGETLTFRGGRIHAPGAGADVLQACRQSNELTLLATFRPENVQQRGPARIVSLSTDAQTRNFTLGQEGDLLILRLRTSTSSGDSTQVSLARIVPGREYTVAVRYRPEHLSVKLDGVTVEVPALKGDFSNWQQHELVFGNEFRDSRPWHGELRRVAIYSRFLEDREIR